MTQEDDPADLAGGLLGCGCAVLVIGLSLAFLVLCGRLAYLAVRWARAWDGGLPW